MVGVETVRLVEELARTVKQLRRPVGPNGRKIGLQRDGLRSGAEDGIRTRDSLLGRQELYH